MATKMGFEGEIYYGVKGSTAATKITNVRDVTITTDTEKGDTTIRGDGTAPPIGTNRVTRVNWSCEFTMLNKTDDTSLEALRVAAAAGTAVAIRMKDKSAGKGFNGDVNLTVTEGHPINGEQTLQFNAEPNGEDRAPVIYT